MVLAQLVRFGVSGVIVTAVCLAVYAIVALALHWHPQLGNIIAQVVGLATGYAMHSRWTFRGHGGDRGSATRLRFLGVSVVAYGLNVFWVWLLYDHFRLGPAAPMLPMAFVTPALTFLLNRQWVFR